MKSKRMISLILACAMLISLLPTLAFAAETDVNPPPYEYVISAAAMGQTDNGMVGRDIALEALTFDGIKTSVSDKWALSAHDMNTVYFRDGGLWTRISEDLKPEWKAGKNGIAFKLDVPQGGIYETKITYDHATHGGIVDVYFIDEKTAAEKELDLSVKSGVTDAISKLEKIASYDTHHASAKDSYMDMPGSITLPAMELDGGEHYLLFTLSGENEKLPSSALRYSELRKFEMSEVNLTEMSLSLEGESAAVGIGSQLFVRYMTDLGKRVDFEGDTVFFESSDADVATVSSDGVVTGVSGGTVTITAKSTIGGREYADSIEIFVDELIFESAEINLTDNELLFVGGTKILSASAHFEDGTVISGDEIAVEYSSDNEAVAKLENGELLAVGEGEASITAAVTFNGETREVTRKIRVEEIKLSGISASLSDPAAFAYDKDGSKLIVTPLNNDGTVVEPEKVIPAHYDYVFAGTVLGTNNDNKPTLDDVAKNPGNYAFDSEVSTGKWQGAARLGGNLYKFYLKGYSQWGRNDEVYLGNNGSAFKLTVDKPGTYKPQLTYFKSDIGANIKVYLVDASKTVVDSAEKITEVTKNPDSETKGITLLGSFNTYDSKFTSTFAAAAETPGTFEEHPTLQLKAQDYYLVISMDAENSNEAIDISSQLGYYLKSFTLSEDVDGIEPEEIEMTCTYESLTPEIVSVNENGYVSYVSAGTGKVKVTAEIYGNTYECICDVISSTQKTEPTIYTYEMRENALENAQKHDWAKSIVKETKAAADIYVENLDFVYNHFPPEGIPRSGHISMKDTPEEMQWRCPHPDCLANIRYEFSYYGWLVDPLKEPWKVQCPKCKRMFPSNDFENFYKLGITEDGTFSRELAIAENEKIVAAGGEGYLVNKLYPELGEEWMVDAGFGWSMTEGYKGTKYDDRICPIAYYTHWLWNTNGVDKRSFLTKAVMTLRDAYLYTGEEKYGVAGTVILDRFADLYPGYDFQKVSIGYLSNHGSAYNGKTTGSAWEKETLIEFIRAADAFYPMAGNEKVISYLSEKAAEFGLENPKLTGDMIRENWDNGILREAYKGLLNHKIYGHNGGSAQIAIAAGIALNCQPETNEYIDWAGVTEQLASESVTCPIFGITLNARVSNTGGNLYNTFFEVIDRDGVGPAVGVSYNVNRYIYAMNNAELMANYGVESDLNILELPKFVKMYTWLPKFALGDGYTLANGDSGSTANAFEVTAPEDFLKAFYYTRDPELAQIYYMWKGGDIDDAYVNMFTDTEELVDEIEKVIATYGEYELHSENLAGYGLAVLRGGELVKGAGGRNNTENRYDTWMYYGATTNSHGHYDALQLGVDAYGFDFTPDLGYPEAATGNPNRYQWIKATISHNTVVVDGDSQNGMDGGNPLHFDDSDKVKLIDAEASSTYEATDIYRRTAVTVAASEADAYTVDFFRVKGGKSHTYSFHTQSDQGYTTDDFKLVPQVDGDGNYIGTYASPDVERGPDPAPGMSESSDYDTMYPRGYSWLINVNRAAEIKSGNFSVNFEQTDFNKQVEDSTGLNLKYTAVNDWIPTELALTTGLPPQKGNNSTVPGLDYMLITRESEEELDTLFTSVIQPYKGEEYIESISSVDVRIKNGSETADDEVKALKVVLKNKRTDYIVYATNNKVTYTISDNGTDVFNFSGFVGVYSVNDQKQNIYTYVHDGKLCGNISAPGAYTGTVMDFTKDLAKTNVIKVKVNGSVDTSKLAGKQIIIDNAKPDNAAYTIKSATADGNIATLDIGDVALIDGLVDYSDISKGYTYNIAVGESFTIPLTNISNSAPEFEAITDNITTNAGSSVSVDVNAESPVGEDVTYIGTVLPRGASIDEKTGVITWSPTASQTGEAGFLITARDGSGRESTMSFEITVYGSTSGGGGGGGDTTTTTPVVPDDKEDEKPDETTPDETTKPDEGTTGETEEVRFIDLGNHAWAESSINSLADEGVIKGTTHNTYSPANNITRADYAVLLVRAFEQTSDNTENFDDVLDTDYFASEIAIARNTGIVEGIGENKFAPRNNITRQDMMVMTYRALVKLGIELETGEVTAPDMDEVSDYAKEAVTALMSSGLINGKDGYIDPKTNTTRAEVAVLLRRILDYAE